MNLLGGVDMVKEIHFYKYKENAYSLFQELNIISRQLTIFDLIRTYVS